MLTVDLSSSGFCFPLMNGTALWRANALGAADDAVATTGHPALDAQLPGGGWPIGAMTELLQAQPQLHAWQLLLPALAERVNALELPVALIGAPYEPFGPSLAARGLPVEALLWVHSDAAPARLWSCEQALRCGDIAAVLAWLPQARVGELRRLQLAAAHHQALLFVFRPLAFAHSASPARLRLELSSCPEDAAQIELRILKRRGPPLAAPIRLPARTERMSALLAASRLRRQQRLAQHAGRIDDVHVPEVLRLPTLSLEVAQVKNLSIESTSFEDTSKGEGYALDRIAVAV